MDQDASNSNASQNESQDPHRMRTGRLDTSSANIRDVPLASASADIRNLLGGDSGHTSDIFLVTLNCDRSL
jgi:hypothetical protein